MRSGEKGEERNRGARRGVGKERKKKGGGEEERKKRGVEEAWSRGE